MSEIMDRPVKTFSIGFDDPSYNELKYSRMVAKQFGTEHYEEVIKPDVVHLVDKLVRYLDEPLADVSIFPTFLVSELARRHVTVVLSGDGGDELFAGYDWYVANQLDRYYQYVPCTIRNDWIRPFVNRIPPSSQKKGWVNKVKRFVDGSSISGSLQHFRWNMYLTDTHKSNLYSNDLKSSLSGLNSYSRFTGYLNAFQSADCLWQQQYADIKTFMVDDILVKVDRMSMANSLEVRTPFLDYRLVEFAASMPSRFKMKGHRTKYILKKSMPPKLPREIINRKKEGFSIPMKNWLRKELRPLMKDVLAPARLKREGLFNVPFVEKLKTEHLSGKANHAHQLWSLTMFEIWRDIYVGSTR